MSNPKKNFIYNIVYQILVMIIPLVVSPYLSRKLGATGVGIYSYTYSVVYYFMHLTLLGVVNYGNRTIAKVRDDKKKLSKSFWSIYCLQLIMGTLMLSLYLLYIFVFDVKYKLIGFIQSLFILSAMLDINWFFFGMEEFKKTITRNTIIKISNAILIFLLVKEPGDVWKYTLIMGSMTCLSQFILWNYLRRYVVFVKVSFDDIKKHIKPNLVLFIPVIAISIYKMMDKIMLGVFSGVTEVGFYENAEKIVNIPLTLITALGTVMLPRVSNLSAKGDLKRIKEYILKSEQFVMFMSIAMCFGLICIGYKFAPLFFGKEFQKSGILIMLLSITLPFLSFANVLRTQYLIPNEKDKIYIKSVFLGALLNLIMNLIFIPFYGSIGACFGTIAAEFSVMFYQSMSCRKELPIGIYVRNIIPFFIKAFIMLMVIYPLNFLNIHHAFIVIFQMALGAMIYSLLNLKYIFTILNRKKKA